MDIDIYVLKMHEQTDLENGWIVMRVPGGWIYTYTSTNAINTAEPNNAFYKHDLRSIFVPITQQSKEEQMEGLLAI